MTITAEEVRATSFKRASRFTRGYDTREVDEFVESIAERLETGSGVSSNDVYRITFTKPPMASRGYAEDSVDEFLERAHAELLRLEDAWGGSAQPGAAPEVDPEVDPAAGGDSDADSDADSDPGPSTGSAS